ncbi:MAG: VWA domain-containing protein [Planctomycetota bacterium]|nr:VWA domain-containing protein [Planctomycetota bacterium]MDA1210968.1 VWA domain-containing protein [Planctomycetota bacterium]
MVLAVFALIAAISMVALGVDLGVVSLTKTKMQNAVDAAALAAAQEIITAVENVGQNSGDGADVADANASAMAPARQMAMNVANMNGVHVDPDDDVRFGKRYYNKNSNTYGITWDEAPYNVVKVTARRDNATPGKDDSELTLFFARIWGKKSTSLTASAVAYVEPRDIVLVLDYSGSMNDDSELGAISKLGQTNVEANIYQIWQDLGSPSYGNMTFTPNWVTIPGQPASGAIPHIKVTWKATEIYVVSTKDLSNVVLEFQGGSTQKFEGLSNTTGTFKGTGSKSGKLITNCWIKSGDNSSGDCPGCGEEFNFYSNTAIKKGLGLSNVAYPYASGSWDDYIEYCRGNSSSGSGYSNDVYNAGYCRKFGILTLIDYWNSEKPKFSQTNALWKTHQYPVAAMRSGASLFTNFLAGLDFGDHVGLVTYDSVGRIEKTLSHPSFPESVNLGNSPLTDQYDDIATIVNHKQAGHYDLYTNIADGINNSIQLLEEHRRAGAKPIIILMTDGNANRKVNGVQTPSGWNWNNLTDYNDDGQSDYSTNDQYKLCAMIKAKEAVDLGFTIHTLTVGVGADRDFMKAIAHMGKGDWIDCPGGTSVGEMDTQLLAAFSKIAANVPPAKLMADPDQAD